MICENCKKPVGVNEKFCGNCGAETIKKIPDERVYYNDSSQTDHDSYEYGTTSNEGGNGEIIAGIIILIIGAALTWITYEAASAGGTYYVFWGLIIYGGYKILKGIAS